MSLFGIFLVTTILGAKYVGAHPSYYCDFGFCESEQYCCGDNKCCMKVTDLWYFWFGIIIAVIIVIALIFFKFYKRRTKYNKYDRVPVVH
ncbi:hypothetical protein TcasGA2_TC034737 [Tribolium castaneum]|uniref:Transmembrane protein n=1 Tax=Tribolium castaneum TaxID=7070 RepID=A0A139WH08_TRICA|nr:PREDICTED: vesicular, overexpressed in cancer, prosurvival protein 1-like [Tribolium castaneum]KYB27087.1 hypothetical protein TcasGA2_TC034737 [Tribolium castaneum]|eukprot:XP_008194750.1 PREDICTED: vesicular, overexpressed in cancer, prosurvival protein 1-like [Tribolium castaneum]